MTPKEQLPPLDFSFIRDLRKRESLTLEDVSNRSGISIGVLSKLERNQNLVELETLYRLGRVFGLSASAVLSLAEECSAHFKTAESYRSGPFDFHKVSYQGVECFHATAKAGESLQRPEAHGDEFEICWVQSGAIKICFTREEHTLRGGESLKFDAALHHTYEILEDADLFIIHLTKSHRF
ncbi:helix-turn-helix domain-containing protein [Rubellicoccus peritrichatus]|uniref:Helix-turn-helix domain-containing protein n=1 Tax=Rubellicoccus peritrichatus TaxID=3080537 RepID=A0AAQ3L599_9BACT|nr:helix-turn-helix domain-containing protein [Puniceicoccus sp. CR14]WOO39410.1 helix-turn-helix domain-containing protein [Puniceicoccus sp. CR14]